MWGLQYVNFQSLFKWAFHKDTGLDPNNEDHVKQYTGDVLEAGANAAIMVGATILIAAPDPTDVLLPTITVVAKRPGWLGRIFSKTNRFFKNLFKSDRNNPPNPYGTNSSGKSGKLKNKLEPDENASGDHTVFDRDDNGNIYKYETYEKTRTGHNNPTKRFDGGKRDGSPGQPHTNKQTKEDVPTPHVQGKNTPGGVRPAEPNDLPNNDRFNNGG